MTKTALFVTSGSIGLVLGGVAIWNAVRRPLETPILLTSPAKSYREAANVARAPPASQLADPLRAPICQDVRATIISELAFGPVPFAAARQTSPDHRRDVRALAGPVRTTPIFASGTLAGFRVSGIRAGSLLGLLGIRNGDVIASVDGKGLSSPRSALEAYARIASRASDRLTVGVRRDGKEVAIHYRID